MTPNVWLMDGLVLRVTTLSGQVSSGVLGEKNKGVTAKGGEHTC